MPHVIWAQKARMEVYYCNADTLHEQVNVTLPKNNMELHAIPEVP